MWKKGGLICSATMPPLDMSCRMSTNADSELKRSGPMACSSTLLNATYDQDRYHMKAMACPAFRSQSSSPLPSAHTTQVSSTTSRKVKAREHTVLTSSACSRAAQCGRSLGVTALRACTSSLILYCALTPTEKAEPSHTRMQNTYVARFCPKKATGFKSVSSRVRGVTRPTGRSAPAAARGEVARDTPKVVNTCWNTASAILLMKE
mmetsp:Transcript_1819/g.4730  ORF Transcript_1819/g.4730 Transcript_1819/m.4730 type:complete len:206 (+) Transcript_1819:82-699(+)